MHVPVMLLKGSYDKLYRNNWRRDPVSGDNSNKQIFTLHIFRGNKQINYRQARQLSNLPCVLARGEICLLPDSDYLYNIYTYIHIHNFVLLIPLKVVHLLGPSCQTASHPHSLPWFALEVWGGQLGLVLQCAVALPWRSSDLAWCSWACKGRCWARRKQKWGTWWYHETWSRYKLVTMCICICVCACVLCM